MRSSIERQRHLLDFTLSSLARRKGKSLALLLVYTLLVFLLASVLFYTHALRREAALLLRDAPALTVHQLSAGRHAPISERQFAVLAAIRGVSRVQGRLWGYYYDPAARANYTLVASDELAGADGEALIGAGVSRSQRTWGTGFVYLVSNEGAVIRLKVRGVFASDSELVSADLVVVSERSFRAIFGTPAGQYTDAALTVRNALEVPTVAAKVTRLIPGARPITRSEILRTYQTIFDWRSGLLVLVVAVAILAFAIVAWDRASGLSAEEKREIGILKAVGWETSDVLLMKFWEGTVISLSAFAVGILAAYVHVFLTPAAILRPILKGWSVIYPEFRLVPFVSGYQIATLFFLTVVPYTVATIIPSWRAATIDPDAVMRGQP